MNMIIDRIEREEDRQYKIGFRVGADEYEIKLIVQVDAESRRIDHVEPWFRDFIFLCNVMHNFSEDFWSFCEGKSIEFPRIYSVTKFTDLPAVARSLRTGIPPAEVQRRYRLR